jgi:hypothetical protein
MRKVEAVTLLTALCLASNAAAIVISGGPVTAPPGGGSCSVSGSPNVGGGATATCSGLNLGAVRHLYFGMRVNQGAVGDALDNTGPTGAEIFRYNSRTTDSARYTGQTQIYNSLVPGYQVVNTELLMGFQAGQGAFVADPLIHALNNGNGDVEVFREITTSSFTVTFKVNAQNGSVWQSAASYFDAVHVPASDHNLDSVNVDFYYDTCGNGTREGSEQCDQGAANGTSGSCCDANCQFRPSSYVCRTGGGAPCDLSETCTGASATCPPDDALAHAGVLTCRFGSGDACDPDEVCDGTPGVACPADVVAPTTVVCRAGAGRPNGGSECDPPEYCPGVPGVRCPNNSFEPSTTPCRAGSGDVCDPQEFCPGIAGGVCPPDTVAPTTTQCRPGSGDPTHSGVECDPGDYCTGVAGQACPTNVPLPPTTVCRPGSGDMCDPDEKCSGISGQPCPANVVADPSTVCRAGSGDMCDPDETCTGRAGEPCPATDVVQPAGTVCRPRNDPVCDIEEQCTGNAKERCPADVFAASGTPCGTDSSVCTVEDCDGSGTCVQGALLSCDDGDPCTQDSCDDVAGCQHVNGPSLACVPATKSTLKIRDADLDRGDALTFNWKGGPVLVSNMGDPIQTTQYDLCVYDSSGVKLHMTVLPGTGWSPLGSLNDPKGYRFRDTTGSQSGIKSIKLRGSSVDRARIKVAGKGVALPDTTHPFLYPVTAQLYASDGACWGADFGQVDTLTNGLLFKARFKRTLLPTPTRTPTAIPTAVPTQTPSPTNTDLPTRTPGGPTDTPTATRTVTPTATRTPTQTPTQSPTATPVPAPFARAVLLPGGGATGSCRGTCVGGTNPGASCASDAICGTGGTCSSIRACIGGAYQGLRCSSDLDCNGCDPNQVCIAAGNPLACCTGSNVGNCPVAGSCIIAQTNSFVGALRVPVNGVCVPRVAPDVSCTTDVECPSGQTCRLSELQIVAGAPNANGEEQLTIPQSSVIFNPAVTSVATLCLTATGDGTGTIDCDGGRASLDLTVKQDHNTTPGDSNNSGSASGLPDDASCTASFTQPPPDGSVSNAHLDSTHAGICNSPIESTLSGSFGAGDIVVSLPVSIVQLTSSGQFGADGLPCTADDTGGPGSPANVLLTTGVASIYVYDANNSRGAVIGPGQTCGTKPCVASVDGAPLSCTALTAGSATGLKFGGGFAGLDAQIIGDVATTFQFVAQ